MWFYAALGAAFTSGIFTAIGKHTLKTIHHTVFFWAILVLSTPAIGLLAYKEGIPSINRNFIIGVVGSVLFYTFSKTLYYRVIKHTELSHVQPLVVLGPVFTLIISISLLSQKPSYLEVLGGIITIIGTYILNISSAHEGILEPFKILFRNKYAKLMLISVVVGSLVVLFDKFAVSNTFPQKSNFTLFAEDLLIVIVLIPWIFAQRNTISSELKNNWKFLILLGAIGTINNILGFIAIAHGNPGIVTSVFRAQVFFALFFSTIILKDYPSRETIWGTIVMIIGLIVVKLGS